MKTEKLQLDDASLIVRLVADVIESPVTSIQPIAGWSSVNRVYIAEVAGAGYVVRPEQPATFYIIAAAGHAAKRSLR